MAVYSNPNLPDLSANIKAYKFLPRKLLNSWHMDNTICFNDDEFMGRAGQYTVEIWKT